MTSAGCESDLEYLLDACPLGAGSPRRRAGDQSGAI